MATHLDSPVTNPDFLTDNAAFNAALAYADQLGLTGPDAFGCLDKFPADYAYKQSEYYSPDQFQRVLNCILQSAILQKTSSVVNGLKGLEQNVQQGINAVGNQIQVQLGEQSSALSDVIDAVSSAIAQSQYQLLQDQMLFTDTVRQFFVAAAEQFVSAVGDAVMAMQNTLKLIQVQNTNDVAALTETIRQIVIGQAQAQADILSKFATVGSTTTDVLQEILDFLKDTYGGDKAKIADSQLDDIVLEMGDLLASDPEIIAHDIIRPQQIMQNIVTGGLLGAPGINALFGDTTFINKFASTLLTTIAVPLMLKDLMSAALVPFSNKLAQDNAAESPFALLPTEVVGKLWLNNYMNDAQVKTELNRAGFDDERIELIKHALEATIPPAELLAWWLRGLIDDDILEEKLQNQGIMGEDVTRLRQAAFFIPPVGDLVTMAVREAFSPEIAQLFGQYEDFPEDFALYASKQGVSETWAKAYWAAHWNLPSPNQGFEMYQRRIINGEELDKLMKAQDIMPFWRDKMRQLAYNPLTRVDVRRMHLLGILGVEDVYNSYLDIGYSPENAKALTEFTVVYNEEVADLGAARDIARDQIMQLYTQHIISRDDAKTLLLNLKYAEADAELLLTLQDVKTDSDYRKAQIGLIVAKAKAGTLSYEEAQNQLTALNITPLELTNALADITNAKTQLTTLPNLTDLRAMYANKLLSEEEFKQWLAALGYNEFWQSRYVSLGKVKANG